MDISIRISRSIVGLLTLTFAALSYAGNVGFPPSADELAQIDPMSPSCGTLAFVDDRLTIDTPDKPFLLDTDNGQFMLQARSNIDVSVDPYSGTLIDGAGDEYYQYAVSVESGTMQLFGSSAALGIPSDALLLAGRIVGLDFAGSSQVAGYAVFVDVEYVHPNIAARVRDIRSLQYTFGTSIWIIPGVTAIPWQTEDPSDINGCFTASPYIQLFSTPLDTEDPITFELKGDMENPAQCILIGPDDPSDYAISYTFDARTPDEHPDPNVGLYVSCDDTYGAPSGSEIQIHDTQWQTSCVKIKVENDIVSQATNAVFDRYTVEVGGREDVRGTILQVVDFDATMLADDRLPLTPPDYDTSAGSTDQVMTAIAIASYCEIIDGDGELQQISDADFDGVADSLDNCILRPNSRQRDSDGDDFGNACDPDFNNDNVVNVTDLGMMRAAFFATGNLVYDLNSDGVVNVVDLGVVRDLFFEPPGPSGLVQ